MNTSKPTAISIRGIIIWLLVSGFFLYEFSLRTLIGTVATQLISDMNLTAGMFAMLGSAYYLAYGGMQIPVGMITDKFGIRNSLLFGASVCVLSAYCLSLSTGFTQAFISRVIMGFGSSFAFVCVLSVVAAWFPRNNFGIFSGMAQFIGTIGPILAAGPLATVLTKLNGDWRLLLNRIGLAGIVLVLLIFLFVKNKSVDKKTTLIIAKKHESAKSRLKRTLRTQQILWISLYSALTYSSLSLIGAVWGTIYLQSHGFSQSVSASAISVLWFGYAIGCVGLGAISDYIKRRKIVLMTCSLIGIISTGGIVFLMINSIYIYMLLFFLVGLAAAGQALSCAAISEHSDNAIKATAFGFNNGSVIIFNVFFPPIIGWTIGSAASVHGGAFQAQDFFYGFSVMPLIYLLAFIISAVFIDETYCKSQGEVLVLRLDNAVA